MQEFEIILFQTQSLSIKIRLPDFLTGRKQRVKLNQNYYSDWVDISAGVLKALSWGRGCLSS
jgi:hypothetical protein